MFLGPVLRPSVCGVRAKPRCVCVFSLCVANGATDRAVLGTPVQESVKPGTWRTSAGRLRPLISRCKVTTFGAHRRANMLQMVVKIVHAPKLRVFFNISATAEGLIMRNLAP